MNIEPYDHPLRFHVTSETEPGAKHLVDLAENKTFGKCSCQHFEFRIQPLIDAGQSLMPIERCKHLKAVREDLVDRVIAGLRDTPPNAGSMAATPEQP